MILITEFLYTFWTMLCEMAPYLLLGFLIAGVMHAFLPKSLYRQHLARPTFSSVVKAAIFGVPLPLCSCGVIPTAMSLRNEGASKGATVSFLIATPQTGVDSIAATYSMLGLPFAIMRPIAAFFTAIAGGAVANKLDHSTDHADSTCTRTEDAGIEHKSILQRTAIALRYGFYDMIQDLGRWLILGLVIAALITMFIPNDFFARYAQYPLLNMLLVLIISIPMYICATGSIPIALALMLKGLSPGAALVLLMAGPATNAASILMVYKVLGKTTTAIYIASIIAGAIIFGLIIDYLLPAQWFSVAANPLSPCCAAHHTQPWVETASGIALTLMLIIGTTTRLFSIKNNKQSHSCGCHSCGCHNDSNTMKRFKITGMMCNHCRTNVENKISTLTGVETVTVDLPTGIATITGNVSDDTVIAAVKALGYECVVVEE